MTHLMGRHAAHPPADTVEDLDGEWHIGRSYPGMFPHHEAQCDCPKAPCGLVIPHPDCEDHNGSRTIRQAHRATDCQRRRHRQ